MKFDNQTFLKTLDRFKRKKKVPLTSSWKRYHEPGLYEYVLYLSSPLRIFFTNLIAGIGRGLGFVLGATVVVAIVVYIVSKILVEIPIVGKSFERLNKLLQESLEKPAINYLDTERE